MWTDRLEAYPTAILLYDLPDGGYNKAMRTVEAIIDPDGKVRLIEPIVVSAPCRALVTILEEDSTDHDSALLSEKALAEDWNRDEEEAAWAHLQPGKSS